MEKDYSVGDRSKRTRRTDLRGKATTRQGGVGERIKGTKRKRGAEE
jgi:hypothetical protein